MNVQSINGEMVTVGKVRLFGHNGSCDLASAIKWAHNTFEYGISTKKALFEVWYIDTSTKERTEHLHGLIGCYNFIKKITKYEFQTFVIRFEKIEPRVFHGFDEDAYLSKQHRTWYENE